MEIGLIIFGIVAIIVIGYVIYRNTRKTTVEETEVPVPVNPGGEPIVEVTEFVGEANPSQSSAENACSVQHTRLYYVNFIHDGITKIQTGDILYNSYPSERTNGGIKWIGLENIVNGEINVIKVGDNGIVLESHTCN